MISLEQRLLETSRSPTVVVNIDGLVTYASAGVFGLLGVGAREAVGMSIFDWLHPDDLTRALDSLAFTENVRDIRYFPMIFRVRHADGHYVEFDVISSNHLDDLLIQGIVLNLRSAEERTVDIGPIRALASGASIDEVLTLLAATIGRGGHLMRAAFVGSRPAGNGAFGAVHAVRADAPLIEAIESIVGLAGNALSLATAAERFACIDVDHLPTGPAAILRAHGLVGLRAATVAIGGEAAAMLIAAEPTETWVGGTWPTSTLDHWVQLLDVATIAFTHHLAQARLVHAATHDPLTGLANRTCFFECLDQMASRSPAVLYIDLDDFKSVNDRFGHGSGDELLIEVARRLSAAVRPNDLVARLGGDEFAIAVPDASVALIAELQRRLEEVVAAPLPLRCSVGRVTISIGAALVDDGLGPSELVRRADAALLAAKRGKAARLTR